MVLKVGDKFSTPVLDKGLTTHKVITLANYSSGLPHGGIDIGQCPIGTPVYAPFDGTVVAISDGVHNNKDGEKIWSGKPSNWILLAVKMKTTFGNVQDATIFFQHLSPGLKVKKGSKVKRAQLLGYSGNSGNSTGPHLHLGAQWVRKGRGNGAATRYDHVNIPALRIWPPERYLDLENLPKKEAASSAKETIVASKAGPKYTHNGKVGTAGVVEHKTPLGKEIAVDSGKRHSICTVVIPKGGRYLLTMQVRMPPDTTSTARIEAVRKGWPGLAANDSTGHNKVPPAEKIAGEWFRWNTFNHCISGGGAVSFEIIMPKGYEKMRFVIKVERIN